MELYGPDERCLYTLMYAPREEHDRLLHELVLPVVRQVHQEPQLDSLFFARYNEPDWQLRFRILGRPEWIEGPVRELVESRLTPLRDKGLLRDWEFAMYRRELVRYGGEEGMRLCERLFLRDTLAFLDLLEAESLGATTRTRREYSLVFVERFLDLFGFSRNQRIAFYRRGFAWAVEGGDWHSKDLLLLEERYRALKDGLVEMFLPAAGPAPADLYGGDEPARIARTCLETMRPVVENLCRAHASGRIDQDLVHLAWSLSHMHANRMGLDPIAEAILRFFMHRLHTEESLAEG